MSNSHGLLLIDKPVDCSSHSVVGRVRRLLNTRDVGHAGTLDPLASGLLVLLVGQATKISDFVLNGDKGYTAQVRLGVRTDTQDSTGEVVSEREVKVDRAQLEQAVQELRGTLSLPVPHYSAVKVKGRKLYEYARQDQPVEAPMRAMTFHEAELIEWSHENLSVHMTCSKGSYVRAWIDELGERLGCGAHMVGLRRTLSHPYALKDAITLEQLEQLIGETGNLDALSNSSFIPLASALPVFPGLCVTGHERHLIQNGQIANSLRGRLMKDLRHSSGRKILDPTGEKMLALVLSDESCNLRIRRVFNY